MNFDELELFMSKKYIGGVKYLLKCEVNDGL